MFGAKGQDDDQYEGYIKDVKLYSAVLDATAIGIAAQKINTDFQIEKFRYCIIDDYNGKRLVITLPGAGGFCNKEFDLVKENEDKFKTAGADEVIVVVGTDILSNAGRGPPNLLQDVSQEFGNANKLTLEGVKSRYLNRAVIAIDVDGEEITRENAELLGCRTLDSMLGVANKAFS